ncbi:Hint domain-containing protein [Aestuariibius sp. HNIBRBA575]|uniref:Hint domain-containing protein n=1 Tax=Aestuariibius sp. HNIBRBA575 TaxID=3233343 RepID=UPI0034A47597
MADIVGTTNNDVIEGTIADDTITGLAGQDVISGEGGDDSISGGAGDDILYGDAGVGTSPGSDSTPLDLSIGNLVSDSSSGNNNAQPNDFAIYSNVAQLDDGTSVSARLVLVSTSDPNLNVDLSGGNGYEILLNSGSGSGRSFGGETATFRMEFFDPATGNPVALNSTATFNDLDRNSPGDQESVTLDANSFNAFGVNSDTSLSVTNQPGSVTAAGTETNNPNDQDAWFSAEFENRDFIEFTLETRSTQSGFSMNGDLIDDPVVEPIEPGNDVIDGGTGQDVIFGQGGNDTLTGGQGDDTLYGGAGEDTLTLQDAQDQVYGGTGTDTITIDPIGPMGSMTVVGGEDADNSDVDTLDLLAGVQAGHYADFNIIDNDANPEDGQVELLDDAGNIIGRIDYSEIENIVICFTPGTMIATPGGEKAVETLREGDKVFTRDSGIQEIRWIGSKTLSAADLAVQPDLQPVLIKAGSLGAGLPERDLMLSPNHRLLLSGPEAQMMFDDSEVLAAAKHLTGRAGVSSAATQGVTYIHVMFDHHEVVLSNGAWSESFQPGDYSLKGLGDAQRDEIFKLFPELNLPGGVENYEAARRVLKKHEALLMAS